MNTADNAGRPVSPLAPGDRRRSVFTLVMTLVVRDEEDILETNLRYHLEQGVDFIYAVDHNSVDATPEILGRFEREGVLHHLRETDEVHDQSRRVTNLARMAFSERGADWVINNDADEFWWPVAGRLKDVLGAVPDQYGKVQARRHDFLPHNGARPFYESMIWRRAQSHTPTGGALEPKVAHRGAPDVVVTDGNHDAIAPTLRVAPELPLIEVLHFPARSYEQFERKIRHTGHGYELLAGRGPGVGRDQLKLLELLRAGELKDYYEGLVVPDAELRRGVEEGMFVKDERLRKFLSGVSLGTAERGDTHQAAELIAKALTFATELEQTRQSLTAVEAALISESQQLAVYRAAHDDLSAAFNECRDTLEAVQNSRVMRATRKVRRIYYRMRDRTRAAPAARR